MKGTTNTIKIEEALKKLRNPNLEREDFIGLICCIVYSTDIFTSNKDIVPFLKKVFNVSYLEYIINSRPLIVARLSRDILNLESRQISEIKNICIAYFSNLNNEQLKDNKKRNANDKLNIWLKEL